LKSLFPIVMVVVKRILHICWGLEPTNGAANIARLIMSEQSARGCEVVLKSWLTVSEIKSADTVWCHCGWYHGIWWAVFWAKIFGKSLHWVPECCYDPMRLAYHGWKKMLVGPVERWALRQCDEIVVTCSAEAEWVHAYEPRVKKTVTTDIKRFFKFKEEVRGEQEGVRTDQPLKVLYLGREHPLKGTVYLKRAVEELAGRVVLKVASTARGDELEALWRWADVFVLPTLSDNFGLVIAEALEHGVPVITTDGAPAWLDLELPLGICLCGYRAGSDEERVRLLKDALARFAHVCVA